MGRIGTVVGAVTVVLAACAGPELVGRAPTTSTSSPVINSVAGSTTAPTTSTVTTVAATTSTVVPVTSTSALPVLPVPVAPPAEDGSSDPYQEIGTIEIPALSLARPLFEGIRLATLDNGPGHWPGTAMPGEVGNTVIAGHRVSHNEDFRHLDRLVVGDEVLMSTSSGSHLYHVTGVEIVGPEALWIVDQTPVPTATLFACHPPGSVRQRIVVHLAVGSASMAN